MAENTELVKVDDSIEIASRDYDVRELASSDAGAFCSIKAVDRASKIKAYNASNHPTHKLNDFINKTIVVKDVYAETLELVNEETGELGQAPRIVLIAEDGESYECVSVGVFSALKKLIAIFGEPTWEEPIKLIVKNEKVKAGTMLTLDAVE